MTRSKEPVEPGAWLAELNAASDQVRRRGGVEDVHRLRTALGRLKVWADMRDDDDLKQAARELRRAAAAVRDFDITAKERGPPAWSEWLAAGRARALKPLVRAVSRVEIARLAIEYTRGKTPRRKDGKALARRFARTTRKRGRRAFGGGAPGARGTSGAPLTRLHAVRRSIRNWRYAREWLGKSAPKLERLQDALGELNDNAIRMRMIQAYPRPATLARLRARVEARIRRERVRAHELWRRLAV